MDQQLLQNISQVVADCLNEDRAEDIESGLDRLFGPSATPHDKLAALALAPIYALVAGQPGYAEDGKPGYLPVGTNLKAAVLHEIHAMIEADFEKGEHRRIWEAIEKSVAATPEKEFVPGVAVNCPDDYLLTLDKLFVSHVLRQYNIMPHWH